MTKTPKPHLKYILDDLAVIKKRLPANADVFAGDDILQDATLMRLVDIGEQLSRVRTAFPEFYAQHETEAWHRLGLRNVVTHGYREVDLSTVWDVVSHRLDNFEKQLRKLV